MLPKKYNYQNREKHWRDYWEENKIYKFEEKSSKPIYSVDTPPPYVSAEHLHAGHIMSYSQAEFVARFKRMQGFNVFYPMGFDDNGLPTERFVEKKYDIDKSKIERSEFIDLCLKETKKGRKNYEDLWTKLGISVDWSKTYSTINELCQRVSQWSFIDLYKKGNIYRKKSPVHWCPFCQTALSQADLEDEELTSSLNYINFDIEGEKRTIATTRPELLPACVAIFANPDDDRYQSLKGKKVTIPLFEHQVPVLYDESVDPEYGSGLMMVCTWGDSEDVEKFYKFDLPTRKAISKDGKMTEIAGKYEELKITEARKKIIEDLKKNGYLIKQENLKHSVNVHERCNTPVEFIPTAQWFIKVLDYKEDLLKKGKELNWYPKHMKQIYDDWVEGINYDWCISRQRYYGVPFPVWYCADCGEPILAKEDSLPVDPLENAVPVNKCPKCNSENIIPEKDVLDTWATSSCTPFIDAELVDNKQDKEKIFPNSLRPQAFEIIRTWLFFSVVKSYLHFDKIPFKDVMISGHGLDKEGKKISKRKGNYVNPDKLLKEYGADAIRYWATGASLGANHKFTLEEVEKGKYLANKLWNASRYCSMNLEDYKPNSKVDLEPEDKWMLDQLNKTIKKVTESFEGYEYAKARKALDDLFWSTFCDYYLEIVKHRSDEEAVKYTLYTCLLNIIKLYAPILPFITEEIYQNLFKKDFNKVSIHKNEWPEFKKDWELEKKELEGMKYFIEEIDNIRKERAGKGLKYKDELENYKIQTKIDKDLFGEKLKKILRIRELK
jgi:valyl-tRNA synthetase